MNLQFAILLLSICWQENGRKWWCNLVQSRLEFLIRMEGLSLFVFLSFWLFGFLSFWLLGFLFFCLSVSDQMSEGYQSFKVTLCVKILKWQSVSDNNDEG